jgi:hypothetical protein
MQIDYYIGKANVNNTIRKWNNWMSTYDIDPID